MVVQLRIKNSIFHPLSGKDKELDGINFIISCADIPCRVYRCHSRCVLRKQNVLHRRILSRSAISVSPCSKWVFCPHHRYSCDESDLSMRQHKVC